MTYEFIQLKMFASKFARLALSLEDLQGIEKEIMTDPKGWPVIAGSGGLRKMRFAPESGTGKSGGLRVCYFIIDEAGKIYLVTLFAKNEQQNIARADLKDFAEVIHRIKKMEKNQ